MRKLAGLLVLIIAGCTEQEAGQSTYLEQPYVADASVQPALLAQQQQAEILRAQIAAEQAERRRLAANAETADQQLVASLNDAIENAEREGQRLPATGAATMPSVTDPQLTDNTALVPLDATNQAQLSQQQPATENQPVAITPGGDGTITDNSFETVTARESIESDAARVNALSQSTVVLEAEPIRESNDGVNLAAFARSTNNRLGQRVYSRTGSRSSAAAARTCRRYPSPDAAQRAFLARGGPQRDPLNIDPDGDGFVCGWSPEPFRNLGG